MKQKEYCRPEIESLGLISENVLCASSMDGNENETFGTNGKLDEVEW